MKISGKKLRLYKAMECFGQIVFWIALFSVLFANMIGVELGISLEIILYAVGIGIWIVGSNLRASLYVCPNCGQKLLIKRAFLWYRVLLKEPPAFCESCGWRVQAEKE